MKITALGVHSAFAVGEYQEGVPVGKVGELVKRILGKVPTGKISDEEISAEIEKVKRICYVPKWHSNFLIEFDMPGKKGTSPYRLLIDAGGDIRHSLKAVGLSSIDIDGVYISHPHADHIGGVEYLGLTTLFNPDFTPAKRKWLGEQFIADKLFLEADWWPRPPESARPDLFIHRKVLETLKRAVGPGLDTVQGVPDVCLDTYFHIHLIGKQKSGETKTHQFHDSDGHWSIRPIFAMHVISSSEEMASYGVSIQHSSGYNVLMPTDTQHMMPPQLEAHYKRADVIYMDCETSVYPSGVHPSLSSLINNLDPEIQKKCLLYHYDDPSNIPENIFRGILKAGDSHTYPETG